MRFLRTPYFSFAVILNTIVAAFAAPTRNLDIDRREAKAGQHHSVHISGTSNIVHLQNAALKSGVSEKKQHHSVHMSGTLNNNPGIKNNAKQPGDGAVKTGMESSSSKAGAGKPDMDSAGGKTIAKKPLQQGEHKAENEGKPGEDLKSNQQNGKPVHTASGDNTATGDYSNKEKETAEKQKGPGGQTSNVGSEESEKTKQKGEGVVDNWNPTQKGGLEGQKTKAGTGDVKEIEKQKETAMEGEGLPNIKVASGGGEKTKKPIEKGNEVSGKEKEKETSGGQTVKVVAGDQTGNTEKQKETAAKEKGVPYDQSIKVASGGNEKTEKTTEKGKENADNWDASPEPHKDASGEQAAKVPAGGSQKEKEVAEKGKGTTGPQNAEVKVGGQKETAVKGEGLSGGQTANVASGGNEKAGKTVEEGKMAEKGKAAAGPQKGAEDGPSVKVAAGDQGEKVKSQKEGAVGGKGTSDGNTYVVGSGTEKTVEKSNEVSDKEKAAGPQKEASGGQAVKIAAEGQGKKAEKQKEGGEKGVSDGYIGSETEKEKGKAAADPQKEASGGQTTKVAVGDQVKKVEKQKEGGEIGESDGYVGSGTEKEEGKAAAEPQKAGGQTTKVAVGDQVKKVEKQKEAGEKGYSAEIGSVYEEAAAGGKHTGSKEKASAGGQVAAGGQMKESEKQKETDVKESNASNEGTTKSAAGGNEAMKETGDKSKMSKTTRRQSQKRW